MLQKVSNEKVIVVVGRMMSLTTESFERSPLECDRTFFKTLLLFVCFFVCLFVRSSNTTGSLPNLKIFSYAAGESMPFNNLYKKKHYCVIDCLILVLNNTAGKNTSL